MSRTGTSETNFRFTHKALEELPPHDPSSPSAQMEYCDLECTGLRFNKGKTGRCFWFMRYRWRGRKCIIKLGEFPGMSLKQARERGWEIRSMVTRGEDPRAAREQKKMMLTLREFVDEQYLPQAKATTRRPDVIISRLNTGALKHLGDRHLDCITTRDVQVFHTAMRHSIRGSRSNWYPVVANAGDLVAEELKVLVSAHGNAVMQCSLDEAGKAVNARIIGDLDPKQRLTFDLVRQRGETDAGELMKAHGDSAQKVVQTAWNNRLAALVNLGLIVELSQGRAKRYRPLLMEE